MLDIDAFDSESEFDMSEEMYGALVEECLKHSDESSQSTIPMGVQAARTPSTGTSSQEAPPANNEVVITLTADSDENMASD